MNLVSLFSGCGGMDIGFEGDFFCLKIYQFICVSRMGRN